MWIVDAAMEMKSVRLGDARLTERAVTIMRAMQPRPSASFPEVFGSSDLEAFYRFTNNDAVAADDLLAPHRKGAWSRVGADRLRLVLHDTTELSFSGERPRKGLERRGRSSLLMAHVSLLVGAGEAPNVYGVVGARDYVLEDHVWKEALPAGALKPLECGSDRWQHAVAATATGRPAGARVVHVMDREADDYPLWDVVIKQGDDFVIRSAQDRRVDGQVVLLAGALAETPFQIQREVWLSRRTQLRPPKERKRHPERDARYAVLSIRFGKVTIRKPKNVSKKELPKAIDLYVVEVVEENPPEGENPVQWRLLTTLPVTTAHEAAGIVDIYRKRWLIEEFFRCLKTGCAAEARQAESRQALVVTTAVLLPLAVRILQLRAAERHAPDESAGSLLDAVECAALRHLAPKAKLPARPTNKEVLLAIALVGGHLKSNGAPGCQVLWRGYAKLLHFVEGWRAALSLIQPGGAGTHE
jgi:hypothetical protein